MMWWPPAAGGLAMDCKTALLLHEYGRPRHPELDTAEVAALEQHLAECPDCTRLVRAERAADDRLGPAVLAVPIPPALRDRLVARLEIERRAGWRPIVRARRV